VLPPLIRWNLVAAIALLSHMGSAEVPRRAASGCGNRLWQSAKLSQQPILGISSTMTTFAMAAVLCSRFPR
jgi:hypothetical protein